MELLSWISKINSRPWHYLWISIVLAEIFTFVGTSVISLIWWGRVSRSLLLIGSIEAFVVSLLVAGIVFFYLQKAVHIEAEIKTSRTLERNFERRSQYFQTILDVFPDPLMVINSDYTIDFANAAAKKLAGKDAIVGSLTCYEASHRATTPCDGKAHPCPIELVRARKEMVHMQHEHWDARGNRRWIDISAAPILDRNGDVQQIIEYGRDVTPQKKAEERLRESEERYRHILAVTPDVITITRVADGRYIEVNDYFCGLSGYTREEILGRTPFDLNLFANPEDRQKLVDLIKRDGEVKDLELRYRQKSGRVIDTLLSARRINLGGEDCLVAVTRDITERKQARIALAESRALFDAFMQHLPSLAFMKDAQGRYIYFNDAWQSFFKRDPETLIGKTDDDLWPAHLAAEIRANDREVLSKGITLNVTESMSASGVIYDYLVSKFPIHRDHRQSIIAGIAIDLQHRIAAEKEKAELEARLQQAQRMEAIGTLAGGIAHDFNNILSAIIGYSEIALLDADQSGTTAESLRNVLVAAQRARDLVKQILTFSRQSDSEYKPVKLRFLVKEVAKLMRATLPATIEIVDDFQSQSNVMADATQLHQVIMNLCTNAAHAMRTKGGTLTLKLQDTQLDQTFARMHPGTNPGRYLELVVEDTGHGIPADMIDRIFFPFFTTKAQGEGTGLGLSVVDGVVKKHGGAVIVESHPDRGSRFHVYLPIIDSRTVERQEETGKPLQGTEKILFVDDEFFQADLARRLLESLGYSVVSVTDSLEALEVFRHDPDRFDLIITDMTMPRMTGEALSREIWSLRPAMPIVLCTGYSEQIEKERALQMGFKDFAMKPIVIEDLARIIRRALDH